jgi:crotonobetainyl-CoA:carnitine CoA-transferase CaiB-like acyl-CoA transferase
MFQLLKGLRIIDATTVVLGPYATRLLGDLGADVIKIEPPEGDVFRAVRPGRSDRMGAGFLNCNRNKRSLVLDLKQEQDRAALLEVVRDADVFVHNMRPKSAEKLGLSYRQLRACNDRIVYCYSPGFGQGGRHAGRPAYDDIIQAMSGLAVLNADGNGEPRFLPTIVCDKVGGLHLALAVLAGVTHRRISGQGCCIEVPMFESMVSFLMAEQLAGETFVPALGRTGYERLLSPYRKPFRTSDGYVTILPYTTSHWRSFLRMVGRAELAEQEWVRDPAERSARVNDLYKVIAEATPKRTTEEWMSALEQVDVPCARLASVADLLNDAHLRDVNFFSEESHPTQGRIRFARSPFRVEGVDTQPDEPAPELGDHTRAVLTEAGLTAEQIDKLISLGVIKSNGTMEGT